MKILVPGGCGYVGAYLVPQLLNDGHHVTVLDTQMFGRGGLPEDSPNLKIVVGNMMNSDKIERLFDVDAVICLAGITSDAMCQKYRNESHITNLTGVAVVVLEAKKAGVKRFIFASSAAAYGSTETEALEHFKLKPTTMYGKYKQANEEFIKDILPKSVIVRSASVCGYSPRQRFDLTVNKMVHDAVKKGTITVNGGEQKRCHIHMKDICDFYKLLLTSKEVDGEVFNAVGENQSVGETARIVQRYTECGIEIKNRTDDRSYQVSGVKAKIVLGFTPKYKVSDAVKDLLIRFEQDTKGITKQWLDSETNPKFQNMTDGLSHSFS